jgi:hypothetical protein
MESFDIININVDVDDIFEYVIGNSCYCPIEKKIDSEKYETYDEFIYDCESKEIIDQDSDYINFSKQVSLLRSNAPKMSGDEIYRICIELEEISPKTIKL